MKIAVIRTSTSRPDLLAKTHEIFLQKVKYSGGFRFIMDEGVFDKPLSDKCVSWAEANGYEVIVDDPPTGQGAAIRSMLNKVTEDYCFALEDDWELIREIDLDVVAQVMNENKDINQICFHKRPIMGEKYGFIKEQVERSGFPLVVSPHWNFIPGLWRAGWIKERMPSYPRYIHFTAVFNEDLKGIKKGGQVTFRDHDWVKENMGTYFWGRHGEQPFINHLGIAWSANLGETPK